MASTDPHPLWQYLPPERRKARHRQALQRKRLLSWFRGHRQRIGLITTLYLLIWCLPLLLGQVLITASALLPLLLVPPVGWLVYWLMWKEFHG